LSYTAEADRSIPVLTSTFGRARRWPGLADRSVHQVLHTPSAVDLGCEPWRLADELALAGCACNARPPAVYGMACALLHHSSSVSLLHYCNLDTFWVVLTSPLLQTYSTADLGRGGGASGRFVLYPYCRREMYGSVHHDFCDVMQRIVRFLSGLFAP
jgi:hypothetical protein